MSKFISTMEIQKNINNKTNKMTAISAEFPDGYIPLKNGETITEKEFLQFIYDSTIKAIQNLPIDDKGKLLVAKDMGIIEKGINYNRIKKTYKIGRQYMQTKSGKAVGECQPKATSEGFLKFTIVMDNNRPKETFTLFLHHEIDHMASYLGYQYELGKEGKKISANLLDSNLWGLKTEFFARINTGNEAMIRGLDRDTVHNMTGKRESDSTYATSMNYSTKFNNAKIKLYNLLTKKYGFNKDAINKNMAIKEPGQTKFANICRTFNRYIFQQDSDKGFLDFIDRIDYIVSSSQTIEQAISRLSGETKEMKSMRADVKKGLNEWNEYKQKLSQYK